LKYLFEGRVGWTISQLSDMELLLHFPSEELRFELTKLKSFEFATASIKAKVEPSSLDKEAVSVREETWVKATGFQLKLRRKYS
jgi:hypothetical protein